MLIEAFTAETPSFLPHRLAFEDAAVARGTPTYTDGPTVSGITAGGTSDMFTEAVVAGPDLILGIPNAHPNIIEFIPSTTSLVVGTAIGSGSARGAVKMGDNVWIIPLNYNRMRKYSITHKSVDIMGIVGANSIWAGGTGLSDRRRIALAPVTTTGSLGLYDTVADSITLGPSVPTDCAYDSCAQLPNDWLILPPLVGTKLWLVNPATGEQMTFEVPEAGYRDVRIMPDGIAVIYAGNTRRVLTFDYRVMDFIVCATLPALNDKFGNGCVSVDRRLYLPPDRAGWHAYDMDTGATLPLGIDRPVEFAFSCSKQDQFGRIIAFPRRHTNIGILTPFTAPATPIPFDVRANWRNNRG